MKNTKKIAIIIVVIIVLAAIGAGAYALINRDKDDKDSDNMTTDSKNETTEETTEAAADDTDSTDAAATDDTKKDDATKTDDSTSSSSSTGSESTNQPAATQAGQYITLADYNADPAKYADSTKVYFFHASWCHFCQAIDASFSSNPGQILDGVTIIKTDFDKNTDLRQKYGVTTQYTFVQVDSSGNEVKQWSAPTAEQAINGISL